MLIISNNVCLNLENAMRPNPNLGVVRSSNQAISQVRLFTKTNRGLIPVVKKWFKIDDVTHNE